jgi:hypothetical protein
MFKEIVSLAIILSFIFNIIYVDHPNTFSYTVYFSLSLAGMAPFVLAYQFWASRREARRHQNERPDARSSASAGVNLEAGRGPTSAEALVEMPELEPGVKPAT